MQSDHKNVVFKYRLIRWQYVIMAIMAVGLFVRYGLKVNHGLIFLINHFLMGLSLFGFVVVEELKWIYKKK